MRALIVENFQERMQLRRSLIELEDQNVQNSIEIGKREVILVMQKPSEKNVHDVGPYGDSDSHPNAFIECEQLKKAIIKNNNVRKKITKRLQANEKEVQYSHLTSQILFL